MCSSSVGIFLSLAFDLLARNGASQPSSGAANDVHSQQACLAHECPAAGRCAQEARRGQAGGGNWRYEETDAPLLRCGDELLVGWR